MSESSDTAIALMKMALALIDRSGRSEVIVHLDRAIEAAEHAHDQANAGNLDRNRC
jgi:hypothetical protein